MKWIYLTYIILCPLFFLPGVEARVAQELFYQIASISVFAIGMFFSQREVKRNNINICLGVMLLVFLVAYLRSMQGLNLAINYLVGLFVYFTMIRTLKVDDLKFLIKGITCLLILATAWLALQKLGFDIMGSTIRNTAKPARDSFFFQGSAMGVYFAQTIPLVLSSTWLGVFFLPVIKFAECSSAYIGVAVGTLFYVWFRKRIVFWVLIPLMLIGGIYLTYNKEAFTGINIRIPLWKVLTQQIVRNPLGHGLDRFNNPAIGGKKYYVNHEDFSLIPIVRRKDGYFIDKNLATNLDQLHVYDNPHNEYLWLGYEVGLHALIILGFLFYFIWQRFYKCRRGKLEVAFMSSLIVFSLCGIGQFNLHLARVGYLLPIIMGGFIISTEEDL